MKYISCLWISFKFVLFSKNLSTSKRIIIAIRVLYTGTMLRREAASSIGEQFIILNAVLGLDNSITGNIAEFGCYKGASSAILSIGAKLTGRKLIIFDFFEGLPTPKERVSNIYSRKELPYQRALYAGTLDQVKRNIMRYGEFEHVEFVKGFFSDVLPARPMDEKYALIFEDADLVSSVRDVLKYAWPRLQHSCAFFCHEARDLEVCQLFFDRNFWQNELGCEPPGLIGVGFGLPTNYGEFEELRFCPWRAGPVLV